MLQRKLTLVDIGGSALPSPSPAAPRYANWFPMPYKAAAVPPVDGVTPNPVADGVLLEWAAVDQEGVVYVIERGPSAQGPWTEIHRTAETRYLYSDGSGQKWWFRITPTVRGKPGAGRTVEATPPTTTADLVEQQEKLAAETLARMRADAAEAAARAAAMAQAAQDLLAEATLRQQQYAEAMQGIADEARARADAVLNEKLAREAAISLEQQTRQSEVESLARALSEVAAGSGTQFDSRAIWYFDQTVEGWTGNGTPTLADGWLRPANAAATPWVQSPAALAVDGSAYRFVKLRVKRVGSPTWAGFLQWITPTDQAWNTQKRVAIAEPAWDANGVATVDVQDIAWWPGTVDRIRLQLGAAQAVANYYLVDWVAVGRPTPGASVALVQAETVARTTAIAAEASQRNTLAVQMRGNYTGTDPLQLTAGLAYEELKARVAADSAQVQRINAMEVRMPAGTGNLATAASVTEEALARVSGDTALAQSITSVNATLPAMIAQGSNMVLNGGWQSGRDVGWSYDSASIVVAAGEGRSGGASMRAEGVNGVRRAIANGIVPSGRDMTVNPGKKYRYGCWYKTTADFNGSADNSKLRLATQTDALIGGATPFLPGKTEWTYVGLVYTIADSTSITALRLSITMNHTAGTLWVDDVSLEEVTDVIANAEGLQALTTTVNNQGGQISAQAGLITALRTDVDGKASNAALQSLQSQVRLQGDDITSLGTAITNVNASLNGLYTRGENLNVNPTFDGTMVPFIKGNTSSANGDVTWFLGAGQQGSAIQFVHKAGATGSPFVYANNGRWTTVSTGPTGRKMRAVVVARVIAGSATLTHRCRVRDGSGESNSDVTTANLTSAWTRYAFEHSIGDSRNEVMSQLWATNRGTSGDATVLVDRIEFYDVTDEVKIDANAAATATLQGTVTQQGQQITAQGAAITTVNADLARGRNSIWPLGTFEAYADGQVLVNNAAGGTYYTAKTSAARNGSRGLEIDVRANTSPTSNADGYLSEYIPVSGNRVIYVEFYARLSADSIDNPTGSFGIGVNTQTEAAGNAWPRTNNATNALSKTEWRKFSGYLTLAANAARMRTFFSIPAANRQVGTIIQIDDVTWQDVTDAQAAQATAAGAASGVSALTATVSQQGQQITAQASRIDGVQASVAGKADASVVQEMRVQVNNQGGGGNLIPNSSFPNWDRTGWGWDWNPSGWQELGDPLPGGGSIPFIPFGVKSALGSRKAGYYNVGAADNVAMQNHSFPLDVAKTYCVSAYVNTHRCRSQLLVECVDFQGNVVGYMGTSINPPRGQSNASLAQYPRDFFIGSPPQGTVRGRLIVQISGNNESDPYFWIVYPMVCEVAAGATKPPPYALGDQASAQWNLVVQANGVSAGMQLGITGQKSALNILSNAVNILSPGGADGIEMTNGYIRTWAGNSQRIIGNNFGADGLIDYFGPNVGAANANKANATMWMDRNGNAYWGGSIAAGILRNAAQSTTTQTIGTSVLVGPFDTNGRNKQVVVSFNRRHIRRKTALGSQGFVAGAGSNGGVINLYRQLDGQGEALWQQIQITGSVDIRNETDGPDIADSVWNASVTLNDNVNGTTRRSYRAEIVSFTEQNVTHQSGSFDSQNITQSLSIVSIEQ